VPERPVPEHFSGGEALKKVSLLAPVAICLVSAGTAQAAEAGTEPVSEDRATPNTIAEIVVSATRREESIQSVPVAITAFNAESLRAKGITEIRDLGMASSYVQVREDVANGGLAIGIRGINVSNDNFSFDAPVGVYFNEIYAARSNDFNGAFYDISRVQVLRGPQGTLFGRNTPVGAILVESNRPDDTFGGYFQTSLGGGGGFGGAGASRFFSRSEGAVNLPVSSSLSLRAAGFYAYDTGWAKSSATGYRHNSRDDFGGRLSASWKPSETTDMFMAYEHNEFKRGAAYWVPAEFYAGVLNYDNLHTGTTARNLYNAVVAAGSQPYAAADNPPDKNTGTTDAGSFNLTQKIGENWSARLILGYRNVRSTIYNDTDGISLPSNETVTNLKQKQYSGELILSGNLTPRIKVLGGLYYFKETGSDENVILNNISTVSATGAGVVAPAGATCYDSSGAVVAPTTVGCKFIDPLRLRGEDFNNRSKAIFGNISWEFIDGLTASFGIRYSKEDKSVLVNSSFLNSRITAGGTRFLAAGREAFSDEVTLYDGKLEWQPKHGMLFYAKYGTGYRAGGIGFRAADAQFKPETAETWELGAKLDFRIGDAPARLNLAAFQNDYKDFQVPVVLLNPTRQTVINAGGARIKGVEAELQLNPTDRLSLSASLGVLDSHYANFVYTDVQLGGLVNLTGNALRSAPDITLSLQPTYEVPTEIGKVALIVNYTLMSSYEPDTRFQRNAPGLLKTSAFYQKSSDNLDVRFRLSDIPGSYLELSAWVRNLTDNARKVYSLTAGFKSVIYSEPRSYGIDLRLAF
jgi:iron complex outermembrane recepter protein